MRVAFVGKGGAGKSVLAGTLARLLARQGHRVLAIDSDPMPGLALSLGVANCDTPLPDEVVEEHPDGERSRWRLRAGLTAEQAVARYALPGPDGVRMLQFGKLRGPAGRFARSQAGFRAIVAGLTGSDWSLIGDLPGGTRQPFFGWGAFADTVCVVAEPSAASLLSARRLSRLATTSDPPVVVAVANKVRQGGDADAVAAGCGLPVVATIPYDARVRTCDRDGRPLLDAAPDSPVVAAVRTLLERLLVMEVTR